jgi:tetratricopeptide (TPR) repeat protein
MENANRVMMVKWFFIGSVCLFCSTWVRGDAASDLYAQGMAALQQDKYADAAQAFDTIITSYPTSPNIDQARLNAGLAHLNAGQFPEAVDRLSREAMAGARPEFRPTALFYTGRAQFYQGQRLDDKGQRNGALMQAVTTFTTLVTLLTPPSSPENKSMLEQSVYFRALAQILKSDYGGAEKDLLELTQSPQFSGSLNVPEYFLRLGSVYEAQTDQAVAAKKPAGEIRALADKALMAFDRVSKDPNALVQANDANMSKADVLFLIAQLDSTPAGYEKALEAFRQVHRKDDLIPLQQRRLDELRKKAQATQLQNAVASLSNETSLLIEREENRLDELKKGGDTIVQALIGMAECYVALKEPDEARTILRRLNARATLAPDQQQQVDLQTLMSYVLGGQTDQADKALTDYLGKHPGDVQVETVSYQIAAELMNRKDYTGALAQAQRSLKDFPKGSMAFDAVGLEAQALTQLGRIKESEEVLANFLKTSPSGTKGFTLLLTRAQNETGEGNLTGALADYQKVRENAAAGPELQSAADAGYIQTLQSLKRFDEVITEAKAFEAKYPNSKALSSVLLFAGLALDEKHDPGALAAVQDIARKYPKDEVTPYALYSVVTIYLRGSDLPTMIQAANDLSKAYPDAYTLIAQAADKVSAVCLKQKKFDDALALYQPLVDAPKPDVAAAARNKIGGIWLAAAKALGAYQSMPLTTRPEAEKRLSSAEQAYLGTLQKSPDQLDAVGEAFDGLVNTMKLRRSWGLLQDAGMEAYLGKLGTGLATPEMQARLELAKVGLVFVSKDGAMQFPAALGRFKKVIEANPGLHLTRQETYQLGELLLAAQDYPTALKVYGDLLAGAAPNDQVAQGDGYYGLGAANFAQGHLAQAKEYFLKLKALPQGGRWHAHILDADYGVALADEQSSQSADADEARLIYAQLMRDPAARVELQAKAMLGFGRLLEKAGNAIKPTAQGPNEYAVHYYQEPHTLFGPAVPELSAEGLFDAGQAYEKAGDKVNAKAQYEDLIKNYGTTDWAAKAKAAEAKAAEAKLGP